MAEKSFLKNYEKTRQKKKTPFFCPPGIMKKKILIEKPLPFSLVLWEFFYSVPIKNFFLKNQIEKRKFPRIKRLNENPKIKQSLKNGGVGGEKCPWPPPFSKRPNFSQTLPDHHYENPPKFSFNLNRGGFFYF